VDGGYGNNGLRVITGGGVSSALDVACYLVSEIFSPGMALFAGIYVEAVVNCTEQAFEPS
jgi:hypothetical protein